MNENIQSLLLGLKSKVASILFSNEGDLERIEALVKETCRRENLDENIVVIIDPSFPDHAGILVQGFSPAQLYVNPSLFTLSEEFQTSFISHEIGHYKHRKWSDFEYGIKKAAAEFCSTVETFVPLSSREISEQEKFELLGRSVKTYSQGYGIAAIASFFYRANEALVKFAICRFSGDASILATTDSMKPAITAKLNEMVTSFFNVMNRRVELKCDEVAVRNSGKKATVQMLNDMKDYQDEVCNAALEKGEFEQVEKILTLRRHPSYESRISRVERKYPGEYEPINWQERSVKKADHGRF